MDHTNVPLKLIGHRELGDKRVLVYSVVLFSRSDMSTPEQLALACGYSTNRHKTSAMAKLWETLHDLVGDGYLKCTANGKYTPVDFDRYGIVYKSDYNSIMGYSSYRINKANALMLLAHIRCYMRKQSGTISSYSNLLGRISECTGLSTRSISQSILALEQVGVIQCDVMPRYIDDNGQWHTNARVFTNKRIYRR